MKVQSSGFIVQSKRLLWMVLLYALQFTLCTVFSGCAGTSAKKTAAAVVPEGIEEETVVIADFESMPNNLGGDVGVYGDGEPNWQDPKGAHSWYYDPASVGYKEANVYKGQQSFRLRNGEKGVSKGWASFNLNLGVTLDTQVEPIKIQPLNVSSYNKLVFYVKGERGGEKFNVIFRDAHSTGYVPQARVTPLPDGCPEDWTRVEILLSKIAWKIDKEKLVSVGLEFGTNVGNRQGTVFYIDEFMFVK